MQFAYTVGCTKLKGDFVTVKKGNKMMRLRLLLLFSFLCALCISSKQVFCEPQEQKTVLITGAAGFIGSNFLCYMFDKYPSYKFLILDSLTYAGNMDNIPGYIKQSPRFEFFYGAIANYHLVDYLMGRANLVVHFAAESHVTNSIYDDNVFFETDINGTRVLMRALVRHKKNIERFVHISTSEVYGTAEQRPMTEDHPLNPCSPYAAAKAGADRLVYAYHKTYDIPVVVLRPFNNYGPCQHIEKVIPRFIIQALRGQQLTVHGSGNQLRDWVHTTDTARAIDQALHLPDFNKIKGQYINIGSGMAISVLDIAHKILKHLNLPDTRINFVDDRPGQVDCHIAAIDKAYKLLNWQPTIAFDDGIATVVDWYKNNDEWWEKSFIISDFMVKTACL